MKKDIYFNVMVLSSSLLNFCIRHKFWSVAEFLIDFRKKKIATKLRELVIIK